MFRSRVFMFLLAGDVKLLREPNHCKINIIQILYFDFNGIKYYWMNARFRAYFNKIFLFLPIAVRGSVRFISERIRKCRRREDRTSPGTSRQGHNLRMLIISKLFSQ